jgi:hypothetical protein
MKLYQHYIHKEAKDANIRIETVGETTEEGTVYDISWWVRGRPLNIWHKALIGPEQEVNWLECDEMGQVKT